MPERVLVCTAAAGGAAVNRPVLAGTGRLPVGHPTREALGMVETAAMAAELALSEINARRRERSR